MALMIYNSYNLPDMVNKSKNNAQNFFSALLSLCLEIQVVESWGHDQYVVVQHYGFLLFSANIYGS